VSLECNGKSGGVTNGSEMAPVRRALQTRRRSRVIARGIHSIAATAHD
jgi:hypothetical protein